MSSSERCWTRFDTDKATSQLRFNLFSLFRANDKGKNSFQSKDGLWLTLGGNQKNNHCLKAKWEAVGTSAA